MDSEITAVLKELVAELRVKNELSRELAEKNELRLKEIKLQYLLRLQQMGYPTPPTGELDSHPQKELDRAKEKRVAFEARFEN